VNPVRYRLVRQERRAELPQDISRAFIVSFHDTEGNDTNGTNFRIDANDASTLDALVTFKSLLYFDRIDFASASDYKVVAATKHMKLAVLALPPAIPSSYPYFGRPRSVDLELIHSSSCYNSAAHRLGHLTFDCARLSCG